MSVVVSQKKQVIFGIILIIIILAVIEAAANIWWVDELSTCEKEIKNRFPQFEDSQSRELCNEMYGLQYNEIRMFQSRAEHDGHINSEGFRGPEITKSKPENTYRVFMVGGSTTYGWLTEDDETPPYYLQQKFNEVNLDFDVQVINAGIPSAFSKTETAMIKLRIIEYEPDLIIAYSGFNERGFEEEERDRDEFRWKERWEEICNLDEQFGFKTIITLQPFLGSGEKKLSKIEQETIDNYPKANTLETLKHEISLIAGKLNELDSVCVKTADLRNLFDDVTEPVFMDKEHAYPIGNKILADKLFELSLPIVKQGPQFKNQSQSAKDFEVSLEQPYFVIRDMLSNYKSPKLVKQFLLSDLSIKSDTGESKILNLDRDHSNIDYSGQDLQNVDFSYSILRNTDFTNADLSGANFFGNDLRETIFTGANLSGVNLKNADLSGQDLTNMLLDGANFANTVLEKTNLSGSILREGFFLRTNLNSADLSNVDFSESKFTFVQMQNSNLRDAKFTESFLIEIDFSNADLTGANLVNAAVWNTDFTNADLSDIITTNSIIQLSQFIGANLKNTDLSDVIFTGSSFYLQDLSGKDLSGTTFIGTNLQKTDLRNTDISKSNFLGADFSNANLSGLDFSGKNLSDTNFIGADLLDTIFQGADFSLAGLLFYLAKDGTILNQEKLVEFIKTFDEGGTLYGRLDISRTLFVDADLRGTDFSNARIAFVNFTNADLTGADLTNANLQEAILDGAILKDVKLDCFNHPICN